jgi:hypothetical protein
MQALAGLVRGPERDGGIMIAARIPTTKIKTIISQKPELGFLNCSSIQLNQHRSANSVAVCWISSFSLLRAADTLKRELQQNGRRRCHGA